MAQVLICGRCGGPLPRPVPGDRFVTCRFCEATSDLDTGEAQASAEPAQFVGIHTRFPAEVTAFEQALAERSGRGEPPLAAFRGAAASALSGVFAPDTLTNVVFGIAADFRERTGTDVRLDAQAMGRIALRYLDVLEALWVFNSRRPSARGLGAHAVSHITLKVNVPSVTTTAQGAIDFEQDVTLERLQTLATTSPVVPEPRPEPPAAPPTAPTAPAPPPAKRSWWKKILG